MEALRAAFAGDDEGIFRYALAAELASRGRQERQQLFEKRFSTDDREYVRQTMFEEHKRISELVAHQRSRKRYDQADAQKQAQHDACVAACADYEARKAAAQVAGEEFREAPPSMPHPVVPVTRTNALPEDALEQCIAALEARYAEENLMEEEVFLPTEPELAP